MIKHVWSVLCQRSVIDQQSNNISLIDIFEQLQVNVSLAEVSKIPKSRDINIPIQYELVNFWVGTKKAEEKANIRIVLTDPDNKDIKRIDKKLIIPKDKMRMRDINKIQGIALRGSGAYKFTISIKQHSGKKYKQVAEVPLEIKVSKGN